MKIKTILSVLLALIIGLTCLTSCKGAGDETTTNAPEVTTEGTGDQTLEGEGETAVERFDYFNSPRNLQKHVGHS